MDSQTYLLIGIALIAALTLVGHYFLISWQVKQLKTESTRQEKEWRKFRREMDEAVKQVYNDKYQRWVIED